MNFFFSAPFFSRNKTALTVLAVALLTASAASAREWLVSSVKNVAPVSPLKLEAVGMTQDVSGQDRVEAEVITILPTGFTPSEINRPRGMFLVVIDNRSGLDPLTLRLDRRDGQRVREVRQTREEKLLKQIEDLPPGEYLLTEASHTNWVCHITITPR